MASHTVDELVFLTSCVRIRPLKQSSQAHEAMTATLCRSSNAGAVCPQHTVIPATALCWPGGKGGATFPAPNPSLALQETEQGVDSWDAPKCLPPVSNVRCELFLQVSPRAYSI